MDGGVEDLLPTASLLNGLSASEDAKNVYTMVEPEARYEKGIMKVTFKKLPEVKPKKIKVKAS